MTVTMDGRAVVEGWVAAAQAGDVERLRSLFAPEAIWRLDGELPISGIWTGRDAILDQFLATAMDMAFAHPARRDRRIRDERGVRDSPAPA